MASFIVAAFVTTVSELIAMAPAANIGDLIFLVLQLGS